MFSAVLVGALRSPGGDESGMGIPFSVLREARKPKDLQGSKGKGQGRGTPQQTGRAGHIVGTSCFLRPIPQAPPPPPQVFTIPHQSPASQPISHSL